MAYWSFISIASSGTVQWLPQANTIRFIISATGKLNQGRPSSQECSRLRLEIRKMPIISRSY
jgi:hypothetical protein